MALQNPVVAYSAATNVEAQLVRTLLMDAGIEAFAVEDVSYAGTWAFGLLPQINKPQVWVDAQDAERAEAVIADYESQSAARVTDAGSDSFCYECGEAIERGQATCPACGKAIDWSDDADSTP